MFFDFVNRLHLSFINSFLRKINSCGTRLTPPIFTRRLFAILSAVIFISVPAFAFGGGSPVLPVGGSFSSGSGTISSSGSSMTINQTASKGIINWQGFSIGKGGSVLFNNGQGATLNRVTGSSMSSIAGLLKATGSLYLINPNGIVITSTGSVITGGDFVASTLNISNSDFLNGNLSFYGSTGSVTNNGSIVSSGNVVLVGTVAVNTGTITAPNGTASLVSGTRLVLIPENGPSGILISPSSLPGNVTNSGIIKAASVYLSSSNGDVYALAGNNGGLIEATGTKTINGQVWLTAPKGTVSVNAPMTASNSDGSGGTILIDGLNNYINPNSILNASGSGGVIKIGLFPSLPESLSTTLSSGATLLAGGINGKGFIDTSGDTLSIGNITVNANGGEWLLDPSDFTVDSTNNSAIDTALGSGGVTISTTSGTSTTSGLTSGSYNTNTGDINIDAPVSWSTGSALILAAYNNMNVNSTIMASGPGELVLDYGNYYETHSAIPGTSMNVTGSLGFTQTSAHGYPTGAVFINGITQELVVLGVFWDGVIYPSHGWCLMPNLPLPPNEMVLAIYYPTVTPPNNNPTNVQPATSMPTAPVVNSPANPLKISYKTYALRHNIYDRNNNNVMKCHSILSPKQSRELVKEQNKKSSKFVKEIEKVVKKATKKMVIKIGNKIINHFEPFPLHILIPPRIKRDIENGLPMGTPNKTELNLKNHTLLASNVIFRLRLNINQSR